MIDRLNTLSKYFNPRVTDYCWLSVDCISLKLEDTFLKFSMWIDCTFENNTISFDWNKVFFNETINDMIEQALQPIMYDKAKLFANEYLKINEIFTC